MIGPKISHDPYFKMGRDSVLNPPESSFSHELPDNDTGRPREARRDTVSRGGSKCYQ